LLTYVRTGKIPAVVLLVGASWLLYATLTSPRYAVQQVRLEGGHALTEADVEMLAAVRGQPIWQIRARDVAAQVEQSPYVEQASARVLLPATVVVHVQERQPAMRWLYAGDGTLYEVAQDGRILAAVTALPSPGAATEPLSDTTTVSPTATQLLSDTAAVSPTGALAATSELDGAGGIVVVDTTPNRPLKPGDYVDPDALEVARRVALRAGELPAPLERITWQQGIGVVLEVGGKTVVVGNSERLDEKLAILVQVLRENTPFSFLDLRPTAPYFR
jgi:cell division protein FtsQ